MDSSASKDSCSGIYFLISFHSLDVLNLLPYPWRQSRTKIVAELNVQVIVALIRYPFDSNFVLAVLFQ